MIFSWFPWARGQTQEILRVLRRRERNDQWRLGELRHVPVGFETSGNQKSTLRLDWSFGTAVSSLSRNSQVSLVVQSIVKSPPSDGIHLEIHSRVCPKTSIIGKPNTTHSKRICEPRRLSSHRSKVTPSHFIPLGQLSLDIFFKYIEDQLALLFDECWW